MLIKKTSMSPVVVAPYLKFRFPPSYTIFNSELVSQPFLIIKAYKMVKGINTFYILVIPFNRRLRNQRILKPLHFIFGLYRGIVVKEIHNLKGIVTPVSYPVAHFIL